MKVLPFTANTETGDQFEIEFPLHPETVDPRVPLVVASESTLGCMHALGRESIGRRF